MQHSLEIDTSRFPSRSKAVRYDTGLLKLQAEYDYVMTRYLLLLPALTSNALFHYQQCVEKYLKSYLAFKTMPFSDTHDLITILDLCQPEGGIFVDPDLRSACESLRDFAVVGRYPNDLMQSFGVEYPGALKFLDEFVYEMRRLFIPRTEGESIADGIKAIELNVSYAVTSTSNNVARNLYCAFLVNNDHAERIIQQFSS